MRTLIRRVSVLILGWAFVLLGIAGLFLPILQGVLFIVIGLLILSTEYVWAHHLVRKLKARFPMVARLSDQASARAKAWICRMPGSPPSGNDDQNRHK